MNDFELGQILGAAFLALIVITALVSSGRRGWGRTIKQSAAWAAIFIVTIAGVGIWQDIQTNTQKAQAISPYDGAVTVPRSRDGHYYLTLGVNGQPIDFVVDTGATNIVLTKADAERVGFSLTELNFFGRANTANGEVRTAPVRLQEVTLGAARDTNVAAYVNEGEMFQSLLGMSYLQRWSSIEIRNNALILTR